MLYNVKWDDDYQWLVRISKNVVVAYLKVLSRHYHTENEKSYERSQSFQSVSWPSIEHGNP